MSRPSIGSWGFADDSLVAEPGEQLDEALGFLIFRIKEGIGLVGANDVGIVLQHHHDEWPLLHRHVFHFPTVQSRIPCEVSVVQEHVERHG